MFKTIPTALTLLLIGCAKPSSTEHNETGNCSEIDLGTQPTERLPTGDVLWLPSSAGEACPELEWALRTDAEGLLLGGEDRFIPLEAGRFVLSEAVTGTELEVVAIDSSEIPFQNLMYLPNASLLGVGDEVWVMVGEDVGASVMMLFDMK